MKMSNSTSKQKFSSTNGFYMNKEKDIDKDSNNLERRIAGSSPVTNILYFNYNSKDSESVGNKNNAVKNHNESVPVFNSNQINPINNSLKKFNISDAKFFSGVQTKSTRYTEEKSGSIIDIDRLRDEIIKLKVENNKIKQEQIETKAENKRFEEDYKKSVKVLEEVLKEGGIAAHQALENILKKNPADEVNMEQEVNPETDDNNPNKAKFNLSSNTFFRLKEMFVINSLKSQIIQLKQQSKKQEEEIANYKNNSRVTRLQKLEQNYNSSSNELAVLRGEYDNLKTQYEVTYEKYKENLEEKNYYKLMMQKYKSQFEDTKSNLKNLKEETMKLKDIRRNQDEKIVYMSKIIKPNNTNPLPKLNGKEKQNFVSVELNEFSNLESKAKEYDHMQIRVNNSSKEIKELLDTIENKNKKISSLENSIDRLKKDNLEQKEESKDKKENVIRDNENLKTENKKLKNDFEIYKQTISKEKDNILDERNKLREEFLLLKEESIKEKETFKNEIIKSAKQTENLKHEIFELQKEVLIKKDLEASKIKIKSKKKILKQKLMEKEELLLKKSEEIKILMEKNDSLENEIRELQNIKKNSSNNEVKGNEIYEKNSNIDPKSIEKEKSEKSFSSEENRDEIKEQEHKQESLITSDSKKNPEVETSTRHQSVIVKPTEVLKPAEEIQQKRMSLKNRLQDIIFDSGKMQTLKNSELNKKTEDIPVPKYEAPKSETIHTSNNFIINVDISDNQEIDPTQSYFVPDPEAEMKKNKAKEIIKQLPPAMRRMKTIEKVMIENINSPEDLEKMLDDPQINLYLKMR